MASGIARIFIEPGLTVEENTLDFIFGNQFISLPQNKTGDGELVFVIEFLEESTVQSFPSDYLNFLIPNHPETLPLLLSLLEYNQLQKLTQIHSLAHSSAMERYLITLKTRPDLFSRVKQRIIASYLGMDSKTLSRIRAKEVRKHH